MRGGSNDAQGRNSLGYTSVFAARESQANKPFLVDDTGSVFKEGNAPSIVCDRVVVCAESVCNLALIRYFSRYSERERQQLLLAQVILGRSVRDLLVLAPDNIEFVLDEPSVALRLVRDEPNDAVGETSVESENRRVGDVCRDRDAKRPCRPQATLLKPGIRVRL